MRSIGRVDRFRLWKTSHEAVLSDTAAHLVLAWRGSCDPLQELVREWCVLSGTGSLPQKTRSPETADCDQKPGNNNQWSHHRYTPSGCGFKQLALQTDLVSNLSCLTLSNLSLLWIALDSPSPSLILGSGHIGQFCA